MKLLHTALDSSLFPFASLPSGTALFDIETTGLSADTSYLYLIGAIHQTEDGPALTQWFCDDFSEEKELLLLFRSFLAEHPTLIHYNGCGFDIPYLNKKFSRYKLMHQIEANAATDLYKLLLPYRKALSLPDFKQKTLEALSGFSRTDCFDGGDLIAVYAAYTGKYRLATLTGRSEEADALRATLLLHNHDDLLGLLSLYQHTNLPNVLEKTLLPEPSLEGNRLCLHYPLPLLPFCGNFPLSVSGNLAASDDTSNSTFLAAGSTASDDAASAAEFGTLSVSGKDTLLSVHIYTGELKYFFTDYKNYTYLIYEDTAIHNSLAQYVDKEAKQKCRPATAYQKKKGSFLPLPLKNCRKPYLFYHSYKTFPPYLELPALSETGFFADYAAMMFSAMAGFIKNCRIAAQFPIR